MPDLLAFDAEGRPLEDLIPWTHALARRDGVSEAKLRAWIDAAARRAKPPALGSALVVGSVGARSLAGSVEMILKGWAMSGLQARVLFWLAVLLPPVVLLFEQPPLDGFCTMSALLAFLGVALAWRYSEQSKDAPLLLQLIFSRLLSGSIGVSFVSIVAFLAITTAFFAWVSDGIKEHNLMLALGGFFYAASVAVFAFMVAESSLRERGEARIMHVVSPLSAVQPVSGDKGTDWERTKLRYEKLKELLPKELAKGEHWPDVLKQNKIELDDPALDLSQPNFFPLLAYLYLHKESVKRVDLHYASDTFGQVPSNVRELYLEVIKEAVRAIVPNVEIREFPVPVPAYDVKRLRNEVYRIYEGDLRRKSQEMAFNITAGTAAISAAYTLVAIRGDAVGFYVRQDNNKLTKEQVITIRLSALDLPDVMEDYDPLTRAFV